MAKTSKNPIRELKPAPQKPSLQKMLNEPGINSLLKMNPRRSSIIDTSKETGNQTAILTASNTQNYIELSDFDAEITQFNSAVSDVLCILLMKGTQEGFNNDLIVPLSVNEYMQRTATTDRKEAKKRLFNAADFLSSVKVPDNNPKKKPTKKSTGLYINISSAVDFKENGDIDFYFNHRYLTNLINGFNMYYTTSVMETNARSYPYARTLGFYISLMKRTNIGKPKEDLIKLSTLIEAGGLPSIEQVKKNGRHYDKEIIEPFERNMDVIKEISWHYCNSKGHAIRTNLLPITAENFFRPDLYIKITWKNYPNTQPLLQAKEKQKAKAEKIRRKKEKEQEKKRG